MKTVQKVRHNRIPQLSTLSAAIMTAMTALPVHAETAAERTQTLPTVDVTAAAPSETVSSPKFTAPLVDTPQTVSVIPAEVFNQQGAQTLTDVLKNTPGISFNAGENGFSTDGNNFSLRGFDTSGSIFLDGVRDSGNYRRDVFNIEQVEVAKGPAADNGRGGAGGYVNQVTKSPKLQDSYSGTVGYGFDDYESDPRRRATIDINKTIGESTAVRLNLLGEDSGVAGREYAEKNSIGVAPSVAFGLGTPTRFVLSHQFLKYNDRPEFGVPAAIIKRMTGDVPYTPSVSSDNREKFYGLASDFDDVTSNNSIFRIEHDLSAAHSISNQTAYLQADRHATYTVPTNYNAGTRVVTTQVQGFERDNTTLSNLTNLSSRFETGTLKHRTAIGVELSREESQANRFPTPNPGPTDIDNPNPYRSAVTLTPSETSTIKVDTIAVYAYDTVELTPQWQVNGGLRAERYKFSIESRTIAGVPLGADSSSASDTILNGKLGVVYKPAPNGSIYLGYGISDQPPGSLLSNPDISRTGDNGTPGAFGQNHPLSKPQRSQSYELGTKWTLLDNRLTTTAAVFQTEKKNIAMGPSPDLVTPPVGVGVQKVHGIELGATGEITEAWTVFAGVVVMNSERNHSADIDTALIAANPGDYTGATTTNGDELAFTPRHSFNLWTTYRTPIGLTLGGGVQEVGDSWIGRPDTADRVIRNGRYGKLPGYTVFNLMAAYEVSKNIGLRLNVDNVTDELYATSSNWNGRRVTLGAPRSYLLSADFKF